ncbi:MAG: EAL domain-containing protein [Oricola sp.]
MMPEKAGNTIEESGQTANAIHEAPDAPMNRLLAANAKVQVDAASRIGPGPNPKHLLEADWPLFRAMIDRVPDYLFVKDTESRFVIANRAVAADLGRQPAELIGKTDFDLHDQEIARKFRSDEQRVLSSGEAIIDIEERLIDITGKEKWFLTSKMPLRNENGEIIGLVGVCRDITDRKRAELQMNFMALHDSLTGLPNRNLLLDRMTQSILQAGRSGAGFAALFIDLDNFKYINDNLGHSAGDALLKTVAERMVASVRAGDTVARLGGDEFVILLVDPGDSKAATKAVLDKLRTAIAEPISIDGQSFRVTCSIGVASYPGDGDNAESLLASADLAMYEAKGNGRDSYQFFTKGMDDAARERRLLQESLRSALVNQEFAIKYQPQVDLATGRIFAVEALLRWNHPVLGEVQPVKFIDLAEESGLIVPLGDWVLREACRQNKAWQDQGIAPITVCVNVSARQFRDKDWVDRVTDILRETGMDSHYLELELTESMLMQDVPKAIATMQKLQSRGVHFAIDDFGTGYSSLSALKNFPVARLKIDSAFVRDIPNNANDRNIASAVISLGQKLNMRVIAEGVETGEQLAFLRGQNCDEIQGYHFSRPIWPDAIARMLRNHASAK